MNTRVTTLRGPHRSALLLSAVLAVVAAACLEIERQRITLLHDVAGDRLLLLLQYDGLHDSGDLFYGKAGEQVRSAVAEGDVMILDWFLGYSPSELRNWLEEESNSLEPVQAPYVELAQFALANVRATALGHTTDFQGHVGAAQLVVIDRAGEFLRLVNRSIDAFLVSTQDREDDDFRASTARSYQLLLEEARRGGRWLSLEGNRFVGSFPVHRHEWARCKAERLADLLESADTDLSGLSGVAVQYTESDGRVELRVGEVDRPLVLRQRTEHAYEPSLEPIVREVLETDFDAQLEREELVEALCLPEDRARAWVRAAERNGDAAAAVTALDGLALAWNAENGLPEAPLRGSFAPDEGSRWLQAWIGWHDELREFPRPLPAAGADTNAR
jgi:hypothetical protein